MLEKPTSLLQEYLNGALEMDDILKYKKIKKTFEDLLAKPSLLLPVVIDIFI